MSIARTAGEETLRNVGKDAPDSEGSTKYIVSERPDPDGHIDAITVDLDIHEDQITMSQVEEEQRQQSCCRTYRKCLPTLVIVAKISGPHLPGVDRCNAPNRNDEVEEP